MNLWYKKGVFKFANLYLVVVFLLISFSVGYYIGKEEKEATVAMADIKEEILQVEEVGKVLNKESVKGYLSNDVDFNMFWEVWKLLERQYVDRPIKESRLFYGAVEGMVAALGDPYTVFFDPEVYKTFTEDFEGVFDGIGAEIGIKQGRIVVIAPLSGMPSELAGLKAGDIILEVDEKDITGISLDQAVNMIRGEKGTEVVLKIYRQGMDQPMDVMIQRGQIIVKSVKWELRDDGVFYINMSHFNDETMDLLNQAITEMKQSNSDKLILDLRNNPGGYLTTSIEVASKWINSKPVVIERFSDGRERKYNATGKTAMDGIKTVVLVDGGSASASEIVAGALQDYDLATIVGKTTFGKGSVQVLEELEDGSAIKITVAKWLTPTGISINDEGISPDFEVTISEEDFENDLDPQLDKAVEILLNKE